MSFTLRWVTRTGNGVGMMKRRDALLLGCVSVLAIATRAKADGANTASSGAGSAKIADRHIDHINNNNRVDELRRISGIETRAPRLGAGAMGELELEATGTAQASPYLRADPDSYLSEGFDHAFWVDAKNFLPGATERISTQREGKYKWGTLDFVYRYLNPTGNHAGVNLDEIGLARDFENSRSVRSAVGAFINRVLDEAQSQNSTGLIYVKDQTISDVELEPGLYSLGHSTLFMEGICNTTDCRFLFGIRDSFTKPLWSDSRRMGLDRDFGYKYPITHNFRPPTPYQYPIPRPR